jgi:hypothetical protein
MRAREIVVELLDSPTKWVKVTNNPFEKVYVWSIGDLKYELVAEETSSSHQYDFWEITFVLENPQPGQDFTLDATGTGNELGVFATVVNIIMTDFIPDVEPSIVYFSAEKQEHEKSTGRVKLYTRLVNKFLPHNYSVNVHNNPDDVSFEIKKDNV